MEVPQGVRDSWGFNPEAQLLQAVVMLPYRWISESRVRKEFWEPDSNKSVVKVMDDVEDGVKYAILARLGERKQNKLSTVEVMVDMPPFMGLVKTPDLYAY